MRKLDANRLTNDIKKVISKYEIADSFDDVYAIIYSVIKGARKSMEKDLAPGENKMLFQKMFCAFRAAMEVNIDFGFHAYNAEHIGLDDTTVTFFPIPEEQETQDKIIEVLREGFKQVEGFKEIILKALMDDEDGFCIKFDKNLTEEEGIKDCVDKFKNEVEKLIKTGGDNLPILEQLKKAIENEDYELAAELKRRIDG